MEKKEEEEEEESCIDQKQTRFGIMPFERV